MSASLKAVRSLVRKYGTDQVVQDLSDVCWEMSVAASAKAERSVREMDQHKYDYLAHSYEELAHQLSRLV